MGICRARLVCNNRAAFQREGVRVDRLRAGEGRHRCT